MLNEERFWDIVALSHKNSKNEYEQAESLVRQIETLLPKEIIGFRLRTDQLLYGSYNSELWCAAYIMNGGCSDDGFEYFRNWIISRGKDTYYRAKEDPDTLVSEVIEGTDYYEFEDFWYVALKAFENKTGEDLYEYVSDDFRLVEGNYPGFETSWEKGNPESMKALCPKLFEKLWPS